MQTWARIQEEAVALRHELHRHPELTWQEAETARRVRSQLDTLDIAWRPCAQHGTVATLGSGLDGEHMALRGDMDALPIQEATDLPYASTVPGCMHACGHDGHTATLWATAAWLKQNEDQLRGPVSLLFQPAEEGGHGARRMIDDGALEGVDSIFGWHNWPALPFGKALCPDGPIMSGNGTFRVTLQGQGGHASQPEMCRDPVLAAAAVTVNLQQIVSRRLPPQAAAVVSVTTIDAKSAAMVIPDTAVLEGSIRIADAAIRDTLNKLIVEITEDTARSYGVEAHVEVQSRYGPTVNHGAQAAHYRASLAEELGDTWRASDVALPIMASEDFSYYLNERPGAFALVGASRGEAFRHPCHSPHYQFNDELIPLIVRLFSRIVGAPAPV